MTAKSRRRKTLKKIKKENTDERPDARIMDQAKVRHLVPGEGSLKEFGKTIPAEVVEGTLIPRNLGEHGPWTPEDQAFEDFTGTYIDGNWYVRSLEEGIR